MFYVECKIHYTPFYSFLYNEKTTSKFAKINYALKTTIEYIMQHKFIFLRQSQNCSASPSYGTTDLRTDKGTFRNINSV